MRKYISVLTLFILSISIKAQTGAIGSWTDHLSYSMASSAASDGTELFCGTESGVYSYNMTDNSITRYSTINLLSDVACQKLAINPYNDVLSIFYKNGNIDLIKNGKTTNIPFVKNSTSISNKNINHISFHKEFALISFDFGIMKLNTEKKEISETYSFRSIDNSINVSASAVKNDAIYVSSNLGIFKGKLSSNLLDYNNWENVSGPLSENYVNIFVFNNNLYAVKDGTPKSLWLYDQNTWIQQNINLNGLLFFKVFNDRLAMITENTVSLLDFNLVSQESFTADFNGIQDIVQISHAHYFLVHQHTGLWEFKNSQYIKSIKPNGPSTQDAFDMAAKNNNLWVVRGGMKNHWNNIFHYGELYHFDGTQWINHSPWSHPLFQKAYDLVDISPDPLNENKIYICSWGAGLLELVNGTPTVLYNDSNSSIVSRTENEYYGIGGSQFDEEGNLWITNSYHTKALSVKKPNGNWKNFDLTGYIDYTTTIGDVVISEAGHKWMLLPRSNEIVIYDDNQTIDEITDDRTLKLSSNITQGNIPGVNGIVVAFDQNGDAWAGSTSGIFVFYNANDIFSNYKKGAQRIIIDGGENNEVLLETIAVKDIAIDGANRKWIATDGSGVYLISEDGKEQIHHFTMENSPLFSNVVNSIALDNETGLVYMGTDKGIMSYRSDATTGNESFSEINVFPNPVRPDYIGPITISGLMSNSTIKITDISGTLINEIKSSGGLATWYGNDFQGNRASTGVYLLFNSAMNEENQLKTEVAKILFVK